MSDDKLMSSLPEKFEDFEKKFAADREGLAGDPAPRRAPGSKKKKLTAADVPGVGGMIEKRWSGLPMWECPKCLATTFKAVEAKIHQCKQVKYAAEEGLAD